MKFLTGTSIWAAKNINFMPMTRSHPKHKLHVSLVYTEPRPQVSEGPGTKPVFYMVVLDGRKTAAEQEVMNNKDSFSVMWPYQGKEPEDYT